MEGIQIKFYEYLHSALPLSLSSPPLPPLLPAITPPSPSCILFFSKFLQQQTAEFDQEINYAKELAATYKCPTLTVHTLCEQSDFPLSFVEQVREYKQKGDKLASELFIVWRASKDKKIQNVFGQKIPSVCSSFPSISLCFFPVFPSHFVLSPPFFQRKPFQMGQTWRN